MTIEAVTFDFWNTICIAPSIDQARASRLQRLRQILADAGADVTDERLDEALDLSRQVFDTHWKANMQYTHVEAVELILHTLEVDLEEVHVQRFTKSFTGESHDGVPKLTPNVDKTLRALSDRGVRLGIICDVGLSPSPVLRRHLDRHELLSLFDHWSFSDEVGSFKPAPEIFEHALAGLGVTADRAAHIGDLVRTDVDGARAAGMTAVRYRGAYDDENVTSDNDASLVIDDHDELLGVLGL